MSDEDATGGVYEWDWRETPEWREVERAISNLMKLDNEAGDPMVTDFIVVAASVPSSLDADDLLGTTNTFCSSRQPYVAKGLLVEAIDIQRSVEEGIL